AIDIEMHPWLSIRRRDGRILNVKRDKHRPHRQSGTLGRTINGQCWRAQWSLNADVQDWWVGFRVRQILIRSVGEHKANRMIIGREPGDLKRSGASPGNVRHRQSVPVKHIVCGPVEEVVRGSSIEINVEMVRARSTDREILDRKRDVDRSGWQ